MNEQFGCVYAIRCTQNGKIYIGSTVQLEERIYQHFQELKAGRKAKVSNVNKIKSYDTWQADYDKYGKNAFEVYCIEQNIPKEELRKREAYWMTEYKSKNPQYGYNASGSVKAKYEIIFGMPPKENDCYERIP